MNDAVHGFILKGIGSGVIASREDSDAILTARSPRPEGARDDG